MLNKQETGRGFTLVEVLVVTALFRILVCLLPTVQAAGEDARRLQCFNNLKPMGAALHNYARALKKPPPGASISNLLTGESSRESDDAFDWIVSILPFIEQQPLNDFIKPNCHHELLGNLTIRSRVPPKFQRFMASSVTNGSLRRINAHHPHFQTISCDLAGARQPVPWRYFGS